MPPWCFANAIWLADGWLFGWNVGDFEFIFIDGFSVIVNYFVVEFCWKSNKGIGDYHSLLTILSNSEMNDSFRLQDRSCIHKHQ